MTPEPVAGPSGAAAAAPTDEEAAVAGPSSEFSSIKIDSTFGNQLSKGQSRFTRQHTDFPQN